MRPECGRNQGNLEQGARARRPGARRATAARRICLKVHASTRWGKRNCMCRHACAGNASCGHVRALLDVPGHWKASLHKVACEFLQASLDVFGTGMGTWCRACVCTCGHSRPVAHQLACTDRCGQMVGLGARAWCRKPFPRVIEECATLCNSVDTECSGQLHLEQTLRVAFLGHAP